MNIWTVIANINILHNGSDNVQVQYLGHWNSHALLNVLFY